MSGSAATDSQGILAGPRILLFFFLLLLFLFSHLPGAVGKFHIDAGLIRNARSGDSPAWRMRSRFLVTYGFLEMTATGPP